MQCQQLDQNSIPWDPLPPSLVEGVGTLAYIEECPCSLSQRVFGSIPGVLRYLRTWATTWFFVFIGSCPWSRVLWRVHGPGRYFYIDIEAAVVDVISLQVPREIGEAM